MKRSPGKPDRLEASTDYPPALLWLMGELGQARASEVVSEFERRLGDLIPSDHRQLNKSGRIKWQHYVRWARQGLVGAGLMGSGGWGVWIITDVGRSWLQKYPDGGKRELAAEVREGQAAAKKPSRPTPDDKPQSIQVDGETFSLSQSQVLAMVQQSLADGIPPEARRFKNWYLEVDGRRVSTKWVISLVTGLPSSRFKTGDARRQLKRLGLEAQSIEQATSTHPVGDTPSRPPELSREAFFQSVLAYVEDKLPRGTENRRVNPNVNYLQLTCPAPGAHYELRLLRSYTEIAIHFEGNRERNLALLGQFRLQREALGKLLKEPIYAETWGANWARIFLKLPPARLDTPTAGALADAWLSFVQATLPMIQRAVTDLGLPVVPELHELTREAFYQTLLARLQGKLPANIHNRGINPNADNLLLNHPAPRTRYELLLRKTYTFLGLVFYGPGEAENRAWLAPFQQALSDLEAKLGQPINIHVGGQSYANVYLHLPPAQLDTVTAHQFADTWLQFIEVTLPVLDRVVADLGLVARGPKPKGKDLERPRTILAREIRNIRAYLKGDQNLSPSDEKLCDWIQFCYTFELFSEGMALFNLVRPNAVHSWLYERTRKIARICELRSRSSD
jgi:hypothetical protein